MTARRALRYLICGSRDWGDWGPVRRVVAALPPGSTVIHGDARGADSMVHHILTRDRPPRARHITVHASDGQTGRRPGGSRRGDIDIEVYPADWDRYRPEDAEKRNPAGMIRNRQMLEEGQPDRCIYFARDLAASPGTRGMVDMCLKAEVPVWDAEDFVRFMQQQPDEDEEDD